MPAGFTLLEVVLAITIIALITTMVYSAFVPTVETTQIVDSQRGLYRRARLALGRMESELRSAYLGNYPASFKRDCQLDDRDCPFFFMGENNGEEDSLTFTTLAGKPGSRTLQADQLWLHYYVDYDSKSKLNSLLRETRFIHKGDFHHDTKPQIQVLFPDVKSFNLRYVDRGTTNQYVEEWDSTRGLDKKETGNLPRAVEVTIVFLDDEGREDKVTTLVELPGSLPYDENAR